MTTPDPFNITKEIDKLTSEVQQDREAGVFLGRPAVAYQHHVFCNASRGEPLGSAGCICTVVYKQDLRELEEKAARLDHLEAENARLRTKNSEWHRRVQAADKAVHDAERCVQEITEGANQGTPWVGGSFGRALLAYGCKRRDDEITSLRTELAAMPQWRDKPTCPGQWLCRWCETELAVSTINAIDIEL